MPLASICMLSLEFLLKSAPQYVIFPFETKINPDSITEPFPTWILPREIAKSLDCGAAGWFWANAVMTNAQ